MPYFTIHYTADGRPCIIEKNYGHKPEKEGSSSHWTWHITRDGVEHLARNNVIRPGHLPTYINDDELEDLKAYNMLARVNGCLLYTSTATRRSTRLCRTTITNRCFC